jgi:hypothetical protein
MMNNPMMQMMQGQLRQMIQQNPQARQAMQVLQGKSPQEQQQMFLNMCKEHNIDPRQFAGQFGINLK